MAASALDFDEKVVLASDCKWKMMEQSAPQKGTLFLTSKNRLVFVTALGVLSKKYQKNHTINASAIQNARFEEGVFGGKRLVIEWNCEGTILTYRYEGVMNAENWVGHIAELVKATRQAGMTYERIVRLINSKETTTFSEIADLLSVARPDFASKSEPEKNREIVELLSSWVDQGAIKGFIDTNNGQFTHLMAYKQKTATRKEKEVVKTVVMVPCKYCGALMPNTSVFCPNCGAKRTG